MEHFILRLGIMSGQAAVVICVILLVRVIFFRLHVAKKLSNLLWLVPFLVMVIPWKIESSISFWRESGQVRQQDVINDMEAVLAELEGMKEKGSAPLDGMPEKDAAPLDGMTEKDAAPLDGMEAKDTAALLEMTVKDAAALLEMAEKDGAALPGMTGKGKNPEYLPKPLPNFQQNPLSNFKPMSDISPDAEDAGRNRGGNAAGAPVSLAPVSENVSFILNAAGIVWLFGVLLFLIYSILSYVKLHRRVICSIHMHDNIYRGDDVDTPFVLGVLRPKIYLPSKIQAEHLPYILEHEKTHIHRHDPLKKLLAFVITGIHWFNPLAWTALHFFGRDMEMACDEVTLERLGIEKKKAYAEVLLLLASGKKSAPSAPIAFGEGNVKCRIRNMADYGKAWKIATTAAAVIMILLAAGFLTEGRHVNSQQSAGADESGSGGSTADGSGSGTTAGGSGGTTADGSGNGGTMADGSGSGGSTAGGSGSSGTTAGGSGSDGTTAGGSGSSGTTAGGSGSGGTTAGGSAENNTPPPAEELTMETLIALCEGGKEKLEKAMCLLPGENLISMEPAEITSPEDIISIFKNRIPYSNFEEDAHKNTLNLWESYFCYFNYNGKKYRLQVSYLKKQPSSEGCEYADGELQYIGLIHPATGDSQTLYDADPRRRPNLDIVSFLQRTYNINDYVILNLPNNLYLGDLQVLGNCQSCLLEGNEEEMIHGQSASKYSYGPGSITVYSLNTTASEEDSIVFKDGKLKDVIKSANHEGPESGYEVIEGCQMQAILRAYSYDLFLLPEGGEYQEKNGLTDEEFQAISIAHHWKIYFTEPDGKYLYELSLNQKFFTKDEAISMARSAVFHEKADRR